MDLQKVVDTNPAPFLLEEGDIEKVFSHKSLFGLPAHIQIAEEEPRDWDRLAFLGDQILAFCTTEAVFERYSTAKPSYLTVKRNLVVNNEQVARWSQAYGFPQRIRAHPSQQHLLRANVTARASVFEAYIGAVFVDGGLQRAQNWLKPLIRLALDESDKADKDEQDSKWQSNSDEPELSQRFQGFSVADEDDTILHTHRSAYGNTYGARVLDDRTEASYSTSYGSFDLLNDHAQSNSPNTMRVGSNTPKAAHVTYSAPPYAFPGSTNPIFETPNSDPRKTRSTGGSGGGVLGFRPTGSPSTVLHSAKSAPNPFPYDNRTASRPAPSVHSSPGGAYNSSPSAPTNNGFLALFNQIASQKHITPEWKTNHSGPPHKPIFESQVLIDGELKGVGSAYNKQTARHIAAKHALKNLGWQPE